MEKKADKEMTGFLKTQKTQTPEILKVRVSDV